jgi:hypothetical protein
MFIVLQERDTERELHRKSPAGDTVLNTKYIIVIESKHKQFIFIKKHTRQITFSIHTLDLCMCQLFEFVNKQNMSTDYKIRNLVVH